MILILGENEDNITDKVCSYLNYYQEPYLRINKSETENIINHILFLDERIEIQFIYNNKQYFLNDFKSIWCRRGRFHTSSYVTKDIFFDSEIKNHFGREKITFINYIYHYIDNNQSIVLNNPLRYEVNKLQSLTVANECGLKIPPTLITNSEIDLQLFPFRRVITKTIQDNLVGLKNGKYITDIGTKNLDVNEIKESFFYSKFQKEIEKKYELRIFYLDGYFYSLAYYFNKDIKEIDSRKLDRKQIRYVPFNLPEEVKNKLAVFMKTMKLESGSIDVIVDNKDDFYFLEVNPIGQFDFLNAFGNFNIEKEIAKYLTNGRKENI